MGSLRRSITDHDSLEAREEYNPLYFDDDLPTPYFFILQYKNN